MTVPPKLLDAFEKVPCFFRMRFRILDPMSFDVRGMVNLLSIRGSNIINLAVGLHEDYLVFE